VQQSQPHQTQQNNLPTTITSTPSQNLQAKNENSEKENEKNEESSTISEEDSDHYDEVGKFFIDNVEEILGYVSDDIDFDDMSHRDINEFAHYAVQKYSLKKMENEQETKINFSTSDNTNIPLMNNKKNYQHQHKTNMANEKLNQSLNNISTQVTFPHYFKVRKMNSPVAIKKIGTNDPSPWLTEIEKLDKEVQNYL
jgi:hypothetical protein